MNRTAFRAGLIASLPYQLALMVFGLISGAIMAEAGLTLFQTLAMSVIVLAGAAQLAAVQLLAEGAPVAVILLTCTFINLRFGMYSAALSPYFGGLSRIRRRAAAYVVHDQSFGVSLARFQSVEESTDARFWFFIAAGASAGLWWQIATTLGHWLGAKAPESWSIDFAMPVIFIAMVVPFLRGAPRWIAASVASGAALLFRDFPLELGLLAATALGIAAGYIAESRR